MRRRAAIRFAEPKLFDEASYATIIGLIDGAEDSLVTNGMCEPHEAEALVARNYILRAAGMIQGATCYVRWDERMGAGYFLSNLPGAASKLKSPKRYEACAEMLSNNPRMFFRSFPYLLHAFLDAELEGLNENTAFANGLVLMAVAHLPGALTEVRRRMMQFNGHERLLIPDVVMEQRMLTDVEYQKHADLVLSLRKI